MGLGNFTNDDEEEETSNNDPQGTHIYFYERGHDRVDSYPEEAQEALAQAYDLAYKNGPVRGAAERTHHNIQHFLATFVIAMGEVMEEGNLVPMLDYIEPSAEDLAIWLDQNPEVGEELVDRFMTHEDLKGETDGGEEEDE